MKVFISTYVTFLEDDYANSFKPKSKVILKEFIFVQDKPQMLVDTSFVPLLLMHVQIGENILKGELAQVEQGIQQIDEHVEPIIPQQNNDTQPSIDTQQPVRISCSERII